MGLQARYLGTTTGRSKADVRVECGLCGWAGFPEPFDPEDIHLLFDILRERLVTHVHLEPAIKKGEA